MKQAVLTGAIAVVLVALSFMSAFWPLALFGLLIAAFSGQWVLAIAIGILLDSIYGAPPEHFAFVHVPFTLVALVLCAIERWGTRYMLEKPSKYL